MRSNRLRTPLRALSTLASVALLGAFAPLVDRPAAPLRAEAAAALAVDPGTPAVTNPFRGDLTDHVVVISLDGLRPDAIRRFRAGTLMRLMREGSYTLNARTIMPSKTLPSHTSMLTGLEPEDHGITWNTDRTHSHGTVEVPTIFAAAHAKGLKTAAFFSKTKFHHLEAPRSLSFVNSPTSGKLSAGQTVREVRKYLRTEKPNLMFVHIGEPDYAGHFWGWMSYMYGRNVRKADDAVESVLEAADGAFGKGNYTVIVTADHGGHGWNHGSSDPRDVTIPWITWGKGVRAGTQLAGDVRTMDTAATALWLLGVTTATAEDGNPVSYAFNRRSAGPALAAR
ncbi:MAG TPA: ectonucleotide pyrophosphatase/phosphodiesterase [Longimicrobiaceae bacterium]|nr:ectonucleotide pyrophosphatase/phosphodiesterase [Longimicrobiaceae bacterium]